MSIDLTVEHRQRPVADGVFTWPADEPALLGSRCRSCETHVFPSQASCPRCTGVDVEVVPLHRHGTLWSFTVQAFPPKAPPYIGAVDEEFRPFGVGYVELDGQVRVEARLTSADPELLRIGAAMELVLVPIGVDDDGIELLTFAFAPIEERQ